MAKKTLGQRIKAFRQIQNLSQQKLADAAGLHMNTIHYIERGTHKDLSGDTLKRISTSLGVTIDDLFG